jgi:hypothetical protein
MPVPKYLTCDNIPEALEQLETKGHPRKNGKPYRRNSFDYCLIHNGKHYAPKSVISWAHLLQTDEHLVGGSIGSDWYGETNPWLRKCGYVVDRCQYKHLCNGLGWSPDDYDGQAWDREEYHDGEIDEIDINAPYSEVVDGHIPNYGHGETIIAYSLPRSWVGKTNVIPSVASGDCHRTLVVAIGFDDSIRVRLLQALWHVGFICRETNLVVFLAMKWDQTEWKLHQQLFQGYGTTCVLRLPFRAALRLT